MARPRPPPPPPLEDVETDLTPWLARAWKEHRKQGIIPAMSPPPTEEDPEYVSPPLPLYLIGQTITVNSLDCSIPFEARATIRPGQQSFQGKIISLHETDEGEEEGYMALVVFPEHVYPDSDTVRSEEIGTSAIQQLNLQS